MKVTLKWNDKVEEPDIDPNDYFGNLPEKPKYNYSNSGFTFKVVEIELECDDPEVMKSLIEEMSKVNE